MYISKAEERVSGRVWPMALGEPLILHVLLTLLTCPIGCSFFLLRAFPPLSPANVVCS